MFQQLLQYLDDSSFKKKLEPSLVKVFKVLAKINGIISTSLFGSLAKVCRLDYGLSMFRDLHKIDL
jgi:hypothetical protein